MNNSYNERSMKIIDLKKTILEDNDVDADRLREELKKKNVEALAGSEHVTNLGCLGDGSVDCPINHIKVEHVVQGFSLGE